MYWCVKKWPKNYGLRAILNSWITAVVTTRVQVYGGMRFEKNSKKSVYLHGGVKVKWCVHKIHRKVCVGVHRCEVNNDKCITSLADDTRPITTAPALFPNTRTNTTIKTRFTVGTWDRTECTAEAPVAPTIVLHHNPGADVYMHIGYMAAAAKRKEIYTAVYTRAYTDSSIYRPLLWRAYRGSTTSICGFVGYLFLLFGIDRNTCCFVWITWIVLDFSSKITVLRHL